MTGRGPTFYEFFAGGGMARLGLGDDWQCLFANEWSDTKARSYRANFPPALELRVDDIWNLAAADLPGHADLAWASFPCQDLSLAGNGAGLDGARSGTLIKFWKLMSELAAVGRAIPVIALENVVGALTSNKGRDFQIMSQLAGDAGYRFGAVVVDAAQFVPQSRSRLFFIAVRDEVNIPASCQGPQPSDGWAHARLEAAVATLSPEARERWIWWTLPGIPRLQLKLTDVMEFDRSDLAWHSPEETARLLGMMSVANAAKVRKAQAYGKPIVGTIYRRVRVEEGRRVQRAEVRFDQVSGCLRTPSGGSSRQTVLFVDGSSIRSRLLTPREAARLMGIPDCYRLPQNYNEGYHLAGDGVVVPVVRFLAKHLLEGLASPQVRHEREAA